jgi:hemoglobin
VTRFAVLAGALIAVCVVPPFARASTADSLYARLGGEAAVTRIADETIERVVKDPRTARSFKDSNLTRVKKHLAQQICELAGGGCRYEGDPMREVHAGHDISEAEFYAMVEILQDVLRAERVGLAERNALLAKLAPMKRDVVRVAPPGAAP